MREYIKPSLLGKRILITRPAGQYADWAFWLARAGADPILFPLIEISPIHDIEQELVIAEKLNKYTWVIFTSANAARYFSGTLAGRELKKSKIRVAAVGSKTAEFLKGLGLEVDFIPGAFTSVHLAENIPDIKGNSILVPRTNIAEDDLKERLIHRGALVDETIVYETKKVAGKQEALQKIVNEGLDVITFASPSAVEAFCEMNIDRGHAKIACIGPVTADKAVLLGLTPDIVAKEHTTEGLTLGIEKYYNKK